MKVLPKEDEGDDGFHRLSFSVRTNEFADALQSENEYNERGRPNLQQVDAV